MIRPVRLAIVDDHEMIRQTWKMILQRNDRIEVIAECASGLEAIECAQKDAPDVMLMDINMPLMNGFEATEKISQQFPEIKIIGISINNQPSYARSMMQLGAKGYVTKNSDSTEMLEAIFSVTEGKTYICKDIRPRMEGKLI
ncbi:MAG TPA: response regulator transcription factor [Flavisolibacter sp.]|jgi:DNA-binding NarL/FixJ family response regulator